MPFVKIFQAIAEIVEVVFVIVEKICESTNKEDKKS
jgi:hypothetical protein